MSNLLEITGDDIAKLRDDDLRSLIGLLCEADYRSAGLPTSGITWGGHQDAADGGVDVAYWGMLAEEVEPPSNAFVPRKNAVIQVKLPEMTSSKIVQEMRPKPKDKDLLKKYPRGILKQSISDLIPLGGAYIIVSAKTNAAGDKLSERINSMRQAIKDEENSQNLHVDFLDQGRVATWVRNHPSMILWVRSKIGRALQGWRPYENWANAPGGIEEDYLLDDGLRLHDGTSSSGGILSVQDGLLRLRRILSSPSSSVRLVGLSGVGKTRLVQALFDKRIGEQPLDSSLAIYTDIADSPSPEPSAMAEQLVASRSRSVLIVDNCSQKLHRRLTKICTQSESTVSLLTVEYDVRDDLPEETSVFKLEPASEEIISTLIQKRFSHISHVDVQSIAEFSGGNARIALAIANTVRHGENLSSFRDNELFERLFWQTDPQKDKTLLRSAEVCSLVYSFDGEDTASKQSELQFLASFAEISAADLHRDVVELKRRELVQSRSKWRAVLPQAIANWLAKRALERIPKDVLIPKFLGTSERLIKSFSRRLGYLHDCKEAVKVVVDWLEPNGWIGEHVGNLNDFGMEVLVNIAPVSPEKTLAAIEQAAQDTEEVFARHQSKFVDLLQQLAYEPKLFERCAHLLCRVALFEWQHEPDNRRQYSEKLRSLFYLWFSGTHAPVEERLKVIEDLVSSQEQHRQELGFYLLEAALEAGQFGAFQDFSFGTRSRDYGYQPRSHEDYSHWFGSVVKLCLQLILDDSKLAGRKRRLFASKLDGIWTRAQSFDVVEKAAQQIHAQKGWHEGWLAVKGIIRDDQEHLNPEAMERLSTLEESLRPVGLLERARTYAFSGIWQGYDLEDEFEGEDFVDQYSKVEKITRTIACQVAQTHEVLNIMLPELVSAHTDTYHGRLDAFGKGLADGATDKAKLFQSLRSEYIKTSHEQRNISVFTGFLFSCSENDPPMCNTLLDGLVEDEVLGKWFPQFQTRCTIDRKAVARLHQSLDFGKAPVAAFQTLGMKYVYKYLNDDELAGLLRKILQREGGAKEVLIIFSMKHSEKRRKDKGWEEKSTCLQEVMRDCLCHYQFYTSKKDRHNGNDYQLAQLVAACLNGTEGADAAQNVCQRFVESVTTANYYIKSYPRFLQNMARVQPDIFLDEFLGKPSIEEGEIPNRLKYFFSRHFRHYKNPLDEIRDEVIRSWCEIAPNQRYPLVTSVITHFSAEKETNQLHWNPIVYAILEQAPDVDSVLKQLEDVIRPMSWSGSLANLLEQRAALLQEFYEHNNENVQSWARNRYTELQEDIKDARESERKREERHRIQDERFE